MNHEMILNVLATAFFLFLYWLYRSEPMEDEGGHGEYAHIAD